MFSSSGSKNISNNLLKMYCGLFHKVLTKLVKYKFKIMFSFVECRSNVGMCVDSTLCYFKDTCSKGFLNDTSSYSE